MGGAGFGKIDHKVSALFGQRDHWKINAVTNALVNDLIHMNFQVLATDIDMVWRLNPVPILEAIAQKEQRDIVVLDDGRVWTGATNVTASGWWYVPRSLSENQLQAYNTGFVFYSPTSNSKKLLDTLLEAWPINARYGSDQTPFNVFTHSRYFAPLLSVHVLDVKRFVGGGFFRANGHMKGDWRDCKKHCLPDEFPNDFVVVHASDVISHLRKIVKLNNIGHWYLTNETECPRFVNYCSSTKGCLPDKYHLMLTLDGNKKFDMNHALKRKKSKSPPK